VHGLVRLYEFTKSQIGGHVIVAAEQAGFARQRATTMIKPSARLPENVFQLGLGEYRWFPFDSVLADEFWSQLTPVAEYFGDTTVFVVCGESLAVETHGHSGVAELAVTDPASAYHAFLDAEGDGLIAARLVGDPIVFFGDTCSWCLFADRSAELAVAAKTAGRDWPPLRDCHPLTLERAIALAELPFRRRMPESVRAAYVRNYGP
jgi:hypothetical protein